MISKIHIKANEKGYVLIQKCKKYCFYEKSISIMSNFKKSIKVILYVIILLININVIKL